MDVIYFNQFGGLIENMVMKGNTLTGDLFLVRDPIDLREAGNKHYIDTLFSNLNTMMIVSGNFTPSNLPGFTGDVISIPGTNEIFLSNRGYSEIGYCKYTVNENGIVIGINTLGSADIPNLDFSKILANSIPTSLAGYGIKDGIDSSGGNLTDNLTLWRDPQSAKEAATLSYVLTQAAANNGTTPVGSLIFKPTEHTPTGYLRCNGSLVAIVTYQALFDVIGHVSGTNPGGGNFYLPDLTSLSYLGYNFYIKY